MKRAWAGLLFAMAYPLFLAWLYFIALAPTPPSQEGEQGVSGSGHNSLVIPVWIAGKAIQFAFPLLWMVHVERKRIQPGFPNFKGLAYGLLLGLVAGVGTIGVYAVMLHNPGHFTLDATVAKVHAKVREFHLETPAAFILVGTSWCVIHSLLEEYYWRWYVFGRLRDLTATWKAIVLSSVAFMAFHVIDLAVFFPGRFWDLAVPLSACVGLGGALWAWLYHRTCSIYSPWLSHLLIDAGILAVGYHLAFVYSV